MLSENKPLSEQHNYCRRLSGDDVTYPLCYPDDTANPDKAECHIPTCQSGKLITRIGV